MKVNNKQLHKNKVKEVAKAREEYLANATEEEKEELYARESQIVKAIDKVMFPPACVKIWRAENERIFRRI